MRRENCVGYTSCMRNPTAIYHVCVCLADIFSFYGLVIFINDKLGWLAQLRGGGERTSSEPVAHVGPNMDQTALGNSDYGRRACVHSDCEFSTSIW